MQLVLHMLSWQTQRSSVQCKLQSCIHACASLAPMFSTCTYIAAFGLFSFPECNQEFVAMTAIYFLPHSLFLSPSPSCSFGPKESPRREEFAPQVCAQLSSSSFSPKTMLNVNFLALYSRNKWCWKQWESSYGRFWFIFIAGPTHLWVQVCTIFLST